MASEFQVRQGDKILTTQTTMAGAIDFAHTADIIGYQIVEIEQSQEQSYGDGKSADAAGAIEGGSIAEHLALLEALTQLDDWEEKTRATSDFKHLWRAYEESEKLLPPEPPICFTGAIKFPSDEMRNRFIEKCFPVRESLGDKREVSEFVLPEDYLLSVGPRASTNWPDSEIVVTKMNPAMRRNRQIISDMRGVLGEGRRIYYDHPGVITVDLSPMVTMVWGTANEEWGADICVDGVLEDSLRAPIRSDREDAEGIGTVLGYLTQDYWGRMAHTFTKPKAAVPATPVNIPPSERAPEASAGADLIEDDWPF